MGFTQEEIQQDPHKYFWGKYRRYHNDPEFKNQILNKEKDMFKLVRNPYTRAVSSFLHTANAAFFISQPDHPLCIEYEKMKKMFNTPNKPVDGISFKQFLHYVKKAGPNRGAIDPHMIKQYMEGEEFYINNYVKLESFSSEIRKIEEKYNLGHSPLSQIIKSPHHHSNKMALKKEFADTIITKELLVGQLPTYKNFYDKETMDLVREIYQQDFEKYGYNAETLE
ncbi:sulfotransferase family 2 domain-containing protein [Neobacillus muris]|uniref:sulfotransferase family 2 domain-containing protein n=1 Tax=Neobacillus muris TaxID=2941334 RepID=UPI0030B9E036